MSELLTPSEIQPKEKAKAAIPQVQPAPFLSLIIPCYNEQDGIATTAESVLTYVKSILSDRPFELILVNDGSTDGTRLLIEDLAEQYPEITALSLPYNEGRGAALRKGIRASRGEFVITLDADLSYDVEHIDEILGAFRKNPRLDVAIVSPYMPGGVVKGVPFSRLMLSKVANWLLAGFFDGKISTVTCVVRGYRGSIIRDIPLFASDKELHLEILRKLSICGSRLTEIPGRLIWKETKKRAKRNNNLKVVDAATKHLLYGFLIKPTRLFKYVAAILVLVGVYECATIAYSVVHYWELIPDQVARSLWLALSRSFAHSPHSFVIGGGSLLMGFQALSYLSLLQVLKLQQEETIRHLLAAIQRPAAEGN